MTVYTCENDFVLMTHVRSNKHISQKDGVDQII